jgi:hypothetical protein
MYPKGKSGTVWSETPTVAPAVYAAGVFLGPWSYAVFRACSNKKLSVFSV